MKLTIAAVLLPLCVSAASYSCQTELRNFSTNRVPTYFVTRTDSIRPTQTVTTTPIYTILDRSTSVFTRLQKTVRTVTNPRITDTFYTTTTLYVMSTSTIVSIDIETSTSTSTTSSTSTTIVPTATGWRPILDTVNRNNLLGRRAASNERKLSQPHEVRALQAKQAGLIAQTAPFRVYCTTYLPNRNTKTVTEIAATITTVKPTWVTVTSISWISSTSTRVPYGGVKGTVTSSYYSTLTTSSTSYTTSTETTSTTSTSIIPGPTIYNACEGSYNNFGPNFSAGGQAYFVANIANNGPGVASDFKIVADGANTPRECCDACQQATGCETFAFRATSRNCFLMYHEGSTCTSQSQHPNFFLSTKGSDTGAGYIVGNGNCGFTYSANSDSSVWPVQLT